MSFFRIFTKNPEKIKKNMMIIHILIQNITKFSAINIFLNSSKIFANIFANTLSADINNINTIKITGTAYTNDFNPCFIFSVFSFSTSSFFLNLFFKLSITSLILSKLPANSSIAFTKNSCIFTCNLVAYIHIIIIRIKITSTLII